MDDEVRAPSHVEGSGLFLSVSFKDKGPYYHTKNEYEIEFKKKSNRIPAVVLNKGLFQTDPTNNATTNKKITGESIST